MAVAKQRWAEYFGRRVQTMYNRKLCCKVPVVGPEGPQGTQGEQGATGAGAQDNGLLFFENL